MAETNGKEALHAKTARATRWSAITEVCAKLFTPIVSMILARLLTPEAFGVVATVNIVISFADMFSDAGFQKYLVQHDFEDDKKLDDATCVAFWSNLTISFLIWAVIAVFSSQLAELVGSPGYGIAIVAAGSSLPLTAFSSIQMARFRRDFDFKTLFSARLISVFTPIAVTVPLAFVFHNFWALIIGTIAVNLCNAAFLTFKSPWKPRFFYSFRTFKDMFSYCWWILLESFGNWAANYLDVLFVGRALNSHYLGLYKTSTTTVGSVMNLIVQAASNPLFSALSRTKDDIEAMLEIYFSYIRALAYFLVPLGFGIWLYSDFVTKVLLGSQWMEASTFIGLWGLTGTVTYVLGTFCNGLYNAIGKTYLSFIAQLAVMAVLFPSVLIAAPLGFEILIYVRSVVRLEIVVIQFVLMWLTFKVTPWRSIRNIFRPMILSAIMCLVAFALQGVSDSILWTIISILICIFVYFASGRLLFKGELTRSLDTLGFNFLRRLKRRTSRE